MFMGRIIRKHDFIYDSSKDVGEKCYNFKREHQDSSILSSRIIFEKENVYLEAADDGKAIFFDDLYVDCNFLCCLWWDVCL